MTLDHMKMKVRRLLAMGLYLLACGAQLVAVSVDGSVLVDWGCPIIVWIALFHAFFTRWNE